MSPQDFKRIRVSLGFSQKQFAMALGLSSANAVSNIETGFRKTSQTIINILGLLESLPKRQAKEIAARLVEQNAKYS